MKRVLSSALRLSVALVSLAVLGALLWPLAVAFLISFTPGEVLEVPRREWSLRWYREFFDQPRWTAGLVNSLVVGCGAAAVSLVAGGGAAIAVERHRFPGRRLLSGAVLFPIFVPALVFGITLLPTMRALGLWGTHLSIIIAHSLWGMPLVFLSVRDALKSADPDLERAARGLGAGPVACFRLVTLPLLAPSLALGAAMAFIVSLNELVMALFLCTAATDTLPKVIWPNIRYTLSPLVAAASGVSVVATFLFLAFAAWVVGGRRSRRYPRLSPQPAAAPMKHQPSQPIATRTQPHLP